MGGRGLGGRSGSLLAAAMFAAVTALCFVMPTHMADGVPLLFTVPIGLLAVTHGLRGGLAGGVVGVGLLAVCSLAEGAVGSAAGYAIRAAGLLVLGGIAGWLADERSRNAASDASWFEASNLMLAEANLDGYFTRLGEQWERCLGWTREELMARPFLELVHPDDLAATQEVARALDAHPGEAFDLENRYLAKDGSWRWLLWTVRSDRHRKYAIARDITDHKIGEQERQELLQRVEALARTDALTGLPNRRSWDEDVGLAIARAERHGQPLVLALFDLDCFKEFNDANGHAAGDALLREAATGWRGELRTTDFLARYGGDEFAVLLPACNAEEAVSLLDRVRAATPQAQTCSVGIASWRQGDSPDALIARADVALYAAKREGRNRVATDP